MAVCGLLPRIAFLQSSTGWFSYDAPYRLVNKSNGVSTGTLLVSSACGYHAEAVERPGYPISIGTVRHQWHGQQNRKRSMRPEAHVLWRMNRTGLVSYNSEAPRWFEQAWYDQLNIDQLRGVYACHQFLCYVVFLGAAHSFSLNQLSVQAMSHFCLCAWLQQPNVVSICVGIGIGPVSARQGMQSRISESWVVAGYHN
ncbi:PDF1B [Symbiodinium necroappetens]|uniref:PDF1B protein n=1 Tax=Symbiodinium necroappetens TaxID=1628268 RepID=A0A813C5G8_9DINO|nr:PDF1B [Symbiodinium necroappetens]